MSPRRLKKSKEDDSEEETTANKHIEMEMFDSDTPLLTDSELTPKAMAHAQAINETNAKKKKSESLCKENWEKTSVKTLTSVKPTEVESLFIFAVMCHMKGKPDIDWDNVALMCGYKSAGVAQVRWGQIKRKLGMSSAEPTTSPMKARAVHTPKSGLKAGGKGIIRTPTTARHNTPSKATSSTNKTPSRVQKNAKTPSKLSAINEEALRHRFRDDEFPAEMDPFFISPSKKTTHFEPAVAPMSEIRAIRKAQEEAARLAKMDTNEPRSAHTRKVNRTLFTISDDEDLSDDNGEDLSSKKGKEPHKIMKTPKKGIARKSAPKPVKMEDLYTARFAKGSNEDVIFD